MNPWLWVAFTFAAFTVLSVVAAALDAGSQDDDLHHRDDGRIGVIAFLAGMVAAILLGIIVGSVGGTL
jgi:hypothetical protein